MSVDVGTSGIDVEAIMAEIRERIAARRASGEYEAYNLAAARALEMDNIRLDHENLVSCLPDLWRASNVDLGDFPIPVKTPVLGAAAVLLKKIIWKLLKFYTFRLFSQQKEFNARSTVLIQAMVLRYEQKLAALEAEIARLREEGASGCPGPSR
ncbi:MAG TPA: hypothetical protein PLI51_05960 [bacterium]|nr:hypothetical protein [bacterium]HPQ66254.1 hypothetical protein [bacterium]